MGGYMYFERRSDIQNGHYRAAGQAVRAALLKNQNFKWVSGAVVALP